MFAIFAYLIEIYIRPQDWASFMYGFPLVNIIAILGLIVALFSLFAKKRPIILPQLYLVIMYLVLVFASNVFSGNIVAGVEQFILFAKCAAVFFIFIFIISDTKQLKQAMVLIVILSVIVAIQIILQSKLGIMVYGQEFKQGTRVAWIGTWDGPNVLCILFALGIAVSLSFTSRTYNILWRVINILFAGVMAYGVYLTNSRGGFLGLMVVALFFFWNKFMRDRKLSMKVVTCVFALIFVMLAFKFGPSRLADLNTQESSAHERTWIWEQGLNLFRENPILGIGKGQYRYQYGQIAHNNFVENMADMGFPGFFVYTGLIYFTLKGLYIVGKKKVADKNNAVLINLSNGLFISMVGFFVITFFVSMELDFLFLWLGLCAAAINIARNEIKGISFRFSLIKDTAAILFIMMAVWSAVYMIAVKEII